MKLAIEGHSTQGSEVIAWLKMLGGMNTFSLNGSETNCYYYIDDNDNIHHCLGIDPRNYIYYTLEEFLEKFPYKVGDKVIDTKTDRVVEIYKAHWSETNNRTYYYVKCFDNTGYIRSHIYLQPYKEETMEERKSINLNELEQQLDEASSKETTESLNKWLDGEPQPKAPILSNRYDYADGKCGYVIPDGYEFDSIKQGFQTEIILRPIKSQYPKTYEECGVLLNSDNKIKMHTIGSFAQLINARNAYWKIAGEQMGLGKPWEPDWSNGLNKCCLLNCENRIIKSAIASTNTILAFPTEEMRDAFYENFKDLIEQCKELL